MVSKSEQAARRRAKAEALRRQEEAQQRRRLVFIIAGAVATAVVVVIIVVAGLGGGTPTPAASKGIAEQIIPSRPTGTTTRQATTTKVADDSGITGVLAWDTAGWPGDGSAHSGALQHDHVSGPVDYTITPPVGGPHDAIWMNAGVYTKPIPTERAVHNLEHGAVWITYDPDLSAADIAKLTAFVTKQTLIPESEQTADQANRYVDLSPWSSSDLPSKIVISAWGHQLRVDSATDSRLQRFVDTFRHSQKYTPEYGAAVDGIPIQTGGRPALDGSKHANPPGSQPEQ